jgi:hypothetical protein
MAVAIRKLSAEESQCVFPRRAQQDLSEYVTALRDLEPGEAASVGGQCGTPGDLRPGAQTPAEPGSQTVGLSAQVEPPIRP